MLNPPSGPTPTNPKPRQINSWQIAEENAARWLIAWGYSDAVRTPGGKDAGLDVVGTRLSAQVKREGRPIGRPVVQQLIGASRRDDDAFLFASEGFSAHAVEAANDRRVALFHYSSEGAMYPASNVARELLA